MANKIDLTPFCDPESPTSRYAIRRPCRIGNLVRATDGRVAIEVDVALAPEWVEPDGRFPRFDDILLPLGSIANWQPCPPVADCKVCKNTGLNLVRCESCEGCGDCDCGNEHECGQCDGTGRVQEGFCKACEFHYANRRLQHKYMLVISRLPECHLGTTSDKPGDAVFFRFTGGRGAIMPCNRTECDE
jgi:hypothetical protein